MNEIDFSREMRSAIRDGDVNRVSALLSAYPNRIDIVTPFGTWLHVASRVGNLNVVKRLVEFGADIDKEAGTFETGPLTTAVSSGHIEIVKYLLSLGSKIDITEPYKNPLFASIQEGRIDIVKVLVDHGIDCTVKYSGSNMSNMDAVAYAQQLGKIDIADFLRSVANLKRAPEIRQSDMGQEKNQVQDDEENKDAIAETQCRLPECHRFVQVQDDEEIKDAIAEAQRRLPEFQRVVEENNRHILPPYGVPMVKICIEYKASKAIEHIWLEGVFFEKTQIVGTVVTESNDMQAIRLGTQVKYPTTSITDWVYYEGGKMHGGFVERILKKRAEINQ